MLPLVLCQAVVYRAESTVGSFSDGGIIPPTGEGDVPFTPSSQEEVKVEWPFASGLSYFFPRKGKDPSQMQCAEGNVPYTGEDVEISVFYTSGREARTLRLPTTIDVIIPDLGRGGRGG